MRSNATEHTVLIGTVLHIEYAVKRHDDREVLHGIDLNITSGEFVVVAGRSGCGESMLLRLIVGLEGTDGGHLRRDGRAEGDLYDDVRVVFQDAHLLPWEKALSNVALGLSGIQRAQAVEVLTQVGLVERVGKWPARLSGRQRQRVALTRTLVHRPRLLLLDEPLDTPDVLTRIDTQNLIEGLWQRLGLTAVLIMHGVAEVVALVNRVVLIKDGRTAPDERANLPCPYHRGSPTPTRLEEVIPNCVMQHKSDPDGLTDVRSHTA